MIPWEHDCKTCLYNTEPKAKACEECRRDLVDVVRCKDCKWWKTNHMWNGSERKVCVIEPYEPVRNEDDFCSRGERREDEAD